MAHDNETEFTQHVASNGTGNQSYYSGQEHQIINGSGTINNYSGAYPNLHESREKIIQALYKSPYLQRKNRNPDRVPGTCEWFFEPRRLSPLARQHVFLYALGIRKPRMWKVVLAKCLFDELKTTEERTTCYFFFKDDFEDQKSAKGALSCILHQLFIQRDNLLSAEIIKRFKSYRAPLANTYYDLWELWDILIMASQERNAGEIICILDAFDECENQDRQDLAKIFLITSRPYDKIRRDLVPFNLEDVPVIHLKGDGEIEAEKIAGEISLYIKDRVSRVRTSFDLTEKEEDLLLQGLGAVQNQTYLWVYLTLEWIETEIHNNISELKIRNAISILPRTVDEAYDKILAKSIDVEETKKLLHIVVIARRPLTLEEMNLALALQSNHRFYKDLEQRPTDRFRKYVRDLCGLFVNIKDGKIYLLHQTAKEFLVPRGNQDSQEGVISQRADDLKPTIAVSSNGDIHSCRLIPIAFFFKFAFVARHPHDKIFLEYSANYWPTHFRASDIEGGEFREQLQQICNANSEIYEIWFRIYWAGIHPGVTFPYKFTTLMVASYLGIETIVGLQLRSPDVKLDVVDNIFERSALSFASEHGFEGIVKLLLKGPKVNLRNVLKNGFRPSFFKGATVDTKDKAMRTPLSYAILSGHLSVVRMLLKAGARADAKDEIGGTPISYALCTGQHEIANELTKQAQESSINEIRDELLLSAVENGHQPIVSRLLDNGADIEAVGKHNMTPLVLAVWNEHAALAQLLIDRGASLHANKGGYYCSVRHDRREMVDEAVECGPVKAYILCVGAKPFRKRLPSLYERAVFVRLPTNTVHIQK